MPRSEDKFCLKWNDFGTNSRSAFQGFRDDKFLCDVSLMCEDVNVEAHKIVLSASSEFFKSVFTRTTHQHPVIYMKGVKSSDLSSLLQFMYHGEVNVAQRDLQSFLAAAEELKINGLTQEKENHDIKMVDTVKTIPPDVVVPSHHDVTDIIDDEDEDIISEIPDQMPPDVECLKYSDQSTQGQEFNNSLTESNVDPDELKKISIELDGGEQIERYNFLLI